MYCIVLYCIVLFILYHVILYYIMWCCIVLYYIILYYIILHYIILHCIILCFVIVYHIILIRIILCYNIFNTHIFDFLPPLGKMIQLHGVFSEWWTWLIHWSLAVLMGRFSTKDEKWASVSNCRNEDVHIHIPGIMFISYSITGTSRSPEWAKVLRRMYAVFLHSTYEDGFGKRITSQDMATATGTDNLLLTLDSLAVTVFLRRESLDFFRTMINCYMTNWKFHVCPWSTRSGSPKIRPTIQFNKLKEVI